MKYRGGKNSGGAYQKIICQIPPHQIYIEPFLGSGAILRMKRAAQVSIGIDLDSRAVDAFNYESIPGAVVKVGCGIQFLESYNFQGNEFVYLDPPYLISTRRRRSRIYLRELSEEDHKRLLAIIKRIPAPVAISGYASSLYEKELKEWRVMKWEAITRGGRLATEHLWMNYEAPVALHDYGYLGEDKTQRQRIKRKIARWERRLAGMPVLERQAMLAAIEKVGTTSA